MRGKTATEPKQLIDRKHCNKEGIKITKRFNNCRFESEPESELKDATELEFGPKKSITLMSILSRMYSPSIRSEQSSISAMEPVQKRNERDFWLCLLGLLFWFVFSMVLILACTPWINKFETMDHNKEFTDDLAANFMQVACFHGYNLVFI